jgi:hypothetical protein
MSGGGWTIRQSDDGRFIEVIDPSGNRLPGVVSIVWKGGPGRSRAEVILHMKAPRLETVTANEFLGGGEV